MHDIVKILTNVRHIWELKKNLTSLGTLDSNGSTYKIENRVMKILKGALIMMKKKTKNNGHYIL